MLTGKSTLVRLLLQELLPKQGICDFGSPNIIPGYYSQDQADTLDVTKTIWEEISQDCLDRIPETDLKGLLSRFMFKNEKINRPIHSLSGGEKARVALCKLMLKPVNLLLLDEVISSCLINIRNK